MLEQSMDPVADGTVKDVASDSMTLEVDGEDYKVLTGNAYVVGKDGIQPRSRRGNLISVIWMMSR